MDTTWQRKPNLEAKSSPAEAYRELLDDKLYLASVAAVVSQDGVTILSHVTDSLQAETILLRCVMEAVAARYRELATSLANATSGEAN